jgi:hypothetical protein
MNFNYMATGYLFFLKEARKNKAEWNKSNVLRPIIKR